MDIIDTTGSGDIDMSVLRRSVNGVLTGMTGRSLEVKMCVRDFYSQIPSAWKAPEEFRVGLVFAFQLFPEDLRSRLKVLSSYLTSHTFI